MDSEQPWGRHETSDSEILAGEKFETMTLNGKKLWRRILLASVRGKFRGLFLKSTVTFWIESYATF